MSSWRRECGRPGSRGGSSFPAPLLGMYIAVAASDRRPQTLPGRLPCPVRRAHLPWKPDVANFRHSPGTRGIALWEAGAVRERRVRMQVPGLTKQSGRSACVLCTSGGAGEPARQPSGRFGRSRRKEPQAGCGIFESLSAVDSGER